MKKLMLGALLIIGLSSVTTHAGCLNRIYCGTRYYTYHHRGTVGLIVGSVATATIGYIFKEQIEMYIEPLIDNFFEWIIIPFRLKKNKPLMVRGS